MKQTVASSISFGLLRLTFSVVLLLTLLCAVASAEVRFARVVQTTTIDAAQKRVDFQVAEGPVARMELVADDLVRVRFNPSGALTSRVSGAISLTPFPAFTANFYDSTDAVYITTGRLWVIVGKNPFRLIVLRTDGSPILTDLEDAYGWETESGTVFTRKFAPAD